MGDMGPLKKQDCKIKSKNHNLKFYFFSNAQYMGYAIHFQVFGFLKQGSFYSGEWPIVKSITNEVAM